MRKIYVVNPNIHDEFKAHLLSLHPFFLGISLQSPATAFGHSDSDINDLELQCFRRISQLKLRHLKQTIAYPSTTQTMISFLQELDWHGIPLNALPQDSDLDQEISLILTTLRPLIPLPRLPLEPVVAIDCQLTLAQRSFLERHNIELIVPKVHPAPRYHYYNTLNERTEIEGILQYCLTHQITDFTLALPDRQKAIPLIESVFLRYGLSFSYQDRSADMMIQHFLLLVNAALDPAPDNLETLILANVLNLKHPHDLIAYMRHFELDDFDLKKPFAYASPGALKDQAVDQLLHLQTLIQPDVTIMQESLLSLKQASYHDTIIACYGLLRLRNMGDLSALKDYLETQLHHHDETTHDLLIQQIQRLSTAPLANHPIKIIEYAELPFTVCDHLFVVNLSSDHYPNMSAPTGILDEQYRQRISGYPSLEVRNQYALQQLFRLFTCAKHIYLSHPVSDYTGKSKDVAYAVQELARQHDLPLHTWTPVHDVSPLPKRRQLSPQLARQLYFQNGQKSGSITSFELFLKDPYQYFLQYGLGVRESSLLSLDARLLGILNHKQAEVFFTDPDTDVWGDYLAYFPVHSDWISIVKKRNQQLMALNMDYLSEFAASTHFKLSHRELPIDEAEIFAPVRLRGIVDRIDANDQSVMIIDYKSSPHRLSEAAVLNKEQLQLLTYAIIVARRLQKPVFGAYYFSFAQPPLTYSYASYSKSKGMALTHFDAPAQWKAAKRLQGWTMMDPESGLKSAQTIQGIREKDGSLSATLYDFHLIQSFMSKLYAKIVDNLLAGVLEKDELDLAIDDIPSLKKESAHETL